MNWQPTATVETLQARAKCLSQIRQFFEVAGVMEVDVPVLAPNGVTDLHIDCIPARVAGGGDGRNPVPTKLSRILYEAAIDCGT